MINLIEKVVYLFLLFAVFIVCLFGMAFLRNTLGIGVEWQMFILFAIAAVWQAAEKWKRK